MNGFEPVKECIYQYTDAGQWGVKWDEKIVRCRDCKYFESDYSDGAIFDTSVCWAWDNGYDSPCFTHPDGFCHRGTRRVNEDTLR